MRNPKLNVLKRFSIIYLSVTLFSIGCDSDDDDDSSTASATFGSLNIPSMASSMAAGIPAGFKTGGLVSLRLLGIGDPLGSDTVAPPPSAGNVLWLVWNLDYNSYCNDEKLSSGECFRVHPSTSTE